MKTIYLIEIGFDWKQFGNELNWQCMYAEQTLQSAQCEMLILRQEEEERREEQRKIYGQVLFYQYYRYRTVTLY